MGRRPGRGPTTLVEDGGKSRTDLAQGLGIEYDDRSMAGATAGGKRDEGAGFFPFSFFVGTMAGEKGESSSWIGGEG